MTTPGLETGLIISNLGRHFLVETPAGRRLICHSRGKKAQGVVGDRVLWQATQDEGTIEKIEPRRNLFYRQDEVRTKSFAANIDQILVLIAAEPEFSPAQLTRALISAEAAGIAPLIGLNKLDLTVPFRQAWQRLQPYRDMGYAVLPLSLKPRTVTASEFASDTHRLQQHLDAKATLVLGPSGAGKSTLINWMVPQASVQTAEISTALNSGKHTTTSTTWYWLDAARQTALIDSPGFQEFGLQHIAPAHLAGLMPDLRAHAGNCKFYNCSHLHEPGCHVIAHVEKPGDKLSSENPDHEETASQRISAHRYKLYGELYAELSQAKY